MNKKLILIAVAFSLLLAFLIQVSNAKPPYSLNVTVQADKPYCPKGELVNIMGNVTYQGGLVENGLVGIQIQTSMRTILLRTLPLNPNQSFPFTIQIESLTPVDESGQYKPITTRKTYLWVEMIIKNNGLSTKTVYASISIADRKRVPLDMDMAILEVPPRSTVKFMPRMYIPSWAATGTAYIYGNVYSLWPKEGGIPLCSEKISNFDIEESSSLLDQYQFGLNGTYEMSFRLRPDMGWGTCYVNVSAWSPSAGGYKGFSWTKFDYWLPGDFDRDYDVDLYDAVGLLNKYGSKEGSARYNEIYDIATPPKPVHADGQINLFDAVLMLTYYGTKPPKD